MTITNLEKVYRQLRDYGDGFADGAFEGQLENAKLVLARSQVYVPRDTEALAKSGRLDAEIRELHMASVDVQYGGAESLAATYAVRQHEDLTLNHPPPESAKYLQRAVDEIEPEMALRIGEHAVAAAKRRAR